MIAPSHREIYIDSSTFRADVAYIESLWQRRSVGNVDLPVLNIGQGEPLVFVPILEHLEFVYARQVRAFSQFRRVILYRRQERRHPPAMGMGERVEELYSVLDSLGIESADLVGHGDGAMVLLEFALRYPERCRSLIIIAQGADYQIAPHPFIWFLHELYLRLPVESLVPAWLLRRSVVNYIVARGPQCSVSGIADKTLSSGEEGARSPTRLEGRGIGSDEHESLTANGRPYRKMEGPGNEPTGSVSAGISAPRYILPRDLIERQFRKIALWSFVYKFSVLPIIHSFDRRSHLGQLTMPVLVINRFDDALSPEAKTHEFAGHLPNCTGYHVISGGERFFMYSEAETVTQIMYTFLAGS